MTYPAFARRSFLAMAAALSLAAGPAATQQDEPVTVFAAASLTDALTAIGKAYEDETGEAVRFSFAASSTLARQIEAGAPADIYASADIGWMDYLAERGLIDPDSRVEPISNSLVLIAPSDSDAADIDVRTMDLDALLGADGRLAVGDPDHVPAGIYAREALIGFGMWETAEPRLARAGDVRAALALVARGEAPFGIVYRTDAAVTDDVKIAGEFPPDCHAPIVYPFAMTSGDPDPRVQRFFAYLTGRDGGAAFDRFGFRRRGMC